MSRWLFRGPKKSDLRKSHLKQGLMNGEHPRLWQRYTMKKHGTTLLLFLILLIGVALLLYPSVSDWWNSQHQSRAIATYSENVADLQSDKKQEMFKSAQEYNKRVKNDPLSFDDGDVSEEYNSVLDITGTGIMGYIEIPTIDVSLPVYHGVGDSVLQVAVGHLEWSSLPVGGESTHCVLSGHRGLPSAKLFTNLDKLIEGDVFMLNTLGETLTYQVDQILIVEPQEVSSLVIIEGRDLCTLVTCTPYGVNSHRLLVRGHRIANPEGAPVITVVSEAGQIDSLIVAPIVATPMLIGLMLYVMIKYRKKK